MKRGTKPATGMISRDNQKDHLPIAWKIALSEESEYKGEPCRVAKWNTTEK